MADTSIPEPYSSIIDAACEGDRAYFEKNPKARQYVRPYQFGEFWPALPTTKAVRVTQVRPGVRTRQPVQLGFEFN